MTSPLRRTGLVGLLGAVAMWFAIGAGAAAAAPPPDDAPPATLPPENALPDPGLQQGSLIPVPVGCPVPDPAAAVFTGTMIGKDDVT